MEVTWLNVSRAGRGLGFGEICFPSFVFWLASLHLTRYHLYASYPSALPGAINAGPRSKVWAELLVQEMFTRGITADMHPLFFVVRGNSDQLNPLHINGHYFSSTYFQTQVSSSPVRPISLDS